MIKIIELISKNNEVSNNNKKLIIPNPENLKDEILKFFEKDLSGANFEIITLFFEK